MAAQVLPKPGRASLLRSNAEEVRQLSPIRPHHAAPVGPLLGSRARAMDDLDSSAQRAYRLFRFLLTLIHHYPLKPRQRPTKPTLQEVERSDNQTDVWHSLRLPLSAA